MVLLSAWLSCPGKSHLERGEGQCALTEGRSHGEEMVRGLQSGHRNLSAWNRIRLSSRPWWRSPTTSSRSAFRRMKVLQDSRLFAVPLLRPAVTCSSSLVLTRSGMTITNLKSEPKSGTISSSRLIDSGLGTKSDDFGVSQYPLNPHPGSWFESVSADLAATPFDLPPSQRQCR